MFLKPGSVKISLKLAEIIKKNGENCEVRGAEKIIIDLINWRVEYGPSTRRVRPIWRNSQGYALESSAQLRSHFYHLICDSVSKMLDSIKIRKKKVHCCPLGLLKYSFLTHSCLQYTSRSHDRKRWEQGVSKTHGTRKTYVLNGYRNFLCQFCKEIPVSVLRVLWIEDFIF